MKATLNGLQDLPTECIVEICKHLNLSSLYSFRATARFIAHIIFTFEDNLAEHFILRDVFAFVHAKDTLTKDFLASSFKTPFESMSFAFYSSLIKRQHIALDLLNLLLSEMNIDRPRSPHANLVRIYTLWSLLNTWQSRSSALSKLTLVHSVAIQSEILASASNLELDALAATVGAITGIICRRLRLDYPRIVEYNPRRGWAILGLPLEELAFFLIADGIQALHNFLFSENYKIDWDRATQVIREGGLHWFFVLPALDVLEQRGHLDRQSKTERFMSVTAFVEQNAERM